MSDRVLGAKISATASYLPPRIMPNSELEKMVETTDDWIVDRTGIKERRIAAPGECTSDLGYKAAKKLLDDYRIDPKSIDLIICATFSPDFLFPATACLIQHRIGAVNAGAYDVEAACTGYVSALSIAAGMVKSGEMKRVLVVASETNSRIMDWTDRNTCVIFGDGAAATLVEPTEPGKGILGFFLRSDGGGAELLEMPAGGTRMPASQETVMTRQHYLRMKGKEIFKMAVAGMSDGVTNLLQRFNYRREDISVLVPHQANKRIMDAVGKRLHLSPQKVCSNIERYGNTSAATIPICLDEMNRGRVEGLMLKSGDLVALTAFGGGLTWGAGLILWE
ncbi:MAG: ketoacyl-ACP synthase III [Candidatus Wallbacteria bacterium]|nr:ketoacyl-ACP synthase III [Candidatus Wallbacteria bacterium]